MPADYFGALGSLAYLTSRAAQVVSDGAATVQAAFGTRNLVSFVVINSTGLPVTVTLPAAAGTFRVQPGENSPALPGAQAAATLTAVGTPNVDVLAYYDGHVQA